MNIIRTFTQDPDERMDYSFNFAPWIKLGDTIATATVTATTGLTISDVDNDSTVVSFVASGGVLRTTYKVTCTITTTNGLIKQASLNITIREA